MPETEITKHPDGRPVIGSFHFNSPQEAEPLLKMVYAGHIGYEIAHVEDPAERSWLYHYIEAISAIGASASMRKRMARMLLESEAFDHFMAKRFGQVKRYGLEGSEAMMLAVDVVMQLTRAGAVPFSHLLIGTSPLTC